MYQVLHYPLCMVWSYNNIHYPALTGSLLLSFKAIAINIPNWLIDRIYCMPGDQVSDGGVSVRHMY